MQSLKCPACGSPIELDSIEAEIKRLRDVRRFLSKIDKQKDCWIWMGTMVGDYGVIGIDRKNIGAHRFSYELHVGPITDGLWVLHRCDNTRCVNPDHLFLGTHQDNMADMNAKGRHARVGGSSPGELNAAAKITRATVDRIMADRKRGMNYVMLGQKYGIGKSQAWNICNGKSWT